MNRSSGSANLRIISQHAIEFEGCRQRIRRAKAHREAIAKMWNDSVTTEDFYSVGVRVEDDGTGSVWIEPVYGWEFTLAISLELGEMLYQLRAALDSCLIWCRHSRERADAAA